DFHVTGVQTCALPIYDPHAGGESLVHDLERRTPAHQEGMTRERKQPGPKGVPHDLVHGVVTPDVLASNQQAAVGVEEPRGVEARSEERRVGKESSSRW